jgi:hypothetical protein
MASKRNPLDDKEPFDFPVVETPGLKGPPMPNAQVVAQLAATVRTPTPEELLAARPPEPREPLESHVISMAEVPGYRPDVPAIDMEALARLVANMLAKPVTASHGAPVATTDPMFVSPTYPVAGQRTMQEIIDQFLADISTHPDSIVLGSNIGGQPTIQQCFKDTPMHAQHRVELRLVYRDAAPQAQAEQAARPWKYDSLIQKKEDMVPTGRAAELLATGQEPGRPWKYDSLIRKRHEPAGV